MKGRAGVIPVRPSPLALDVYSMTMSFCAVVCGGHDSATACANTDTRCPTWSDVLSTAVPSLKTSDVAVESVTFHAEHSDPR